MNSSSSRNAARVLMVLCVVGLLYVSLYPFHFTRTAKESGMAWHGPVLDSDWVDMAANFVGYVPLGFLGVVARRRRNGASVLVSVLLGAILSLGIELAQMYLPQRDSNFRDLLFDTAGALAGSLGAFRAVRFFPQLAVPRLPPVAVALILLWATWQMFPFFPLLKRYKLHELVAHLSQWDFQGREFGDIAFAAFSLYALAAWPAWSRTATAGLAALILFPVLLGQSVVVGIVYSNVRFAAAAAGLVLAFCMWRPQWRWPWTAAAAAIAGWTIFRGLDPIHLNDPGIRGLAGETFLLWSVAVAAHRALMLPSAPGCEDPPR